MSADHRTTASHVPMTSAEVKQSLRAAVRERRDSRGPREHERRSAAIREHALDALQALAPHAECVAAYVSRATEPGTRPLIEALSERGISTLLPVLGPSLCRDWARYTSVDDLAVRAPGRPPEPSAPPEGETALRQAALVFAPALSVDCAGIRLGQGGGWYDRALLHRHPDAPVVAVVYDEEVRSEPLPREPHDLPVHAVVTPSQWWLIPPVS